MESHDRDQLDDLLDGTLKQYGSVEPRVGLEGRVLARLAGVDRQPHLWTLWAWGSALAASVCTVLVVLALTRTPHSHQPPAAVQPPPDLNSKIAHEVQMPADTKRRTTMPRRPRLESELAKARRPSEFPSPHPLSKQERLLKAYVSNFPQQAALIAHEQAEREKELAAMGWENTVIPDSN